MFEKSNNYLFVIITYIMLNYIWIHTMLLLLIILNKFLKLIILIKNQLQFIQYFIL